MLCFLMPVLLSDTTPTPWRLRHAVGLSSLLIYLPPSVAEWLRKHPSFSFTPSPSIILGAFEVHVASQFLDHLIANNFFPPSTSAGTLLSHGSLSEGYSLRHLSLRITSVFLPCSISDFHHTCSRTFRPLEQTFLELSYLSRIHSVALCFEHS